MDVFILDDSIESALSLGKVIEHINTDITIHYYNDYKPFLNEISNLKNGIIFMDIVMPNLNGIQVSNFLTGLKYDLPIVLYSGMPKEMYDVYDCNHVYFLEKPFDPNKVKKAIQLSIAYLENNFFTYTFAKTINKIPFCSIVYFESKGKTVRLITTTETKIFYEKLDDIETRITIPFVRVSKSYLINPQYIAEINDSDISIKPIHNLDSIKKISISRMYKKKVLNNDLFIKHN